jgi:serine/threonine protein kinase
MNQNSLPIGTLLINKYKILSVIGQGGFGITYLAQHTELHNQFAIKECFVRQWCKRDICFVCAYDNDKSKFEEFKVKFLNEAQTLARLDHKNIVRVTDYFEENNTGYFAMEFIEGDSLRKIIDRNGKSDEDFSIKLILKLSEAIEFLHQRKILHRDIKPDNIIIKADNEPVLLDFGAAREIAGTKVPHTIILTPGYAPIEQSDPNSEKGFYIDIYSIGATLYNLVTGQIPVPAQHRITEEKLIDPQIINPSISDKVRNVILKSMAILHYHRYQTINEFITAITSSIKDVTFDLEQSGLTQIQKKAFVEIERFIKSPDQKIFILTGSSNSGKSFLIKRIIDYLHSIKRSNLLLASTSRVAESLRQLNGFEKVTSLYTLVYNFSESSLFGEITQGEIVSGELEEENIEKIRYDYKKNIDDPNMVYLLDNSELVSDDSLDFELYVFGSGKLLQDFFEYSQINNNNKNRKIIFVGDDKQLLRGSKNLSSLNIQHIHESYNLELKLFELNEIFSIPGFEIINKNIFNLQNKLGKGVFNNLDIEFNNESCIHLKEEDIIPTYLSLTPKDTIILEHTNRSAKTVNEQVRKILERKGYLEIGDRVTIYNNINAVDDFNQSFHFANGEFAEVVGLYEKISEAVYRKGKQNYRIELKFRKVKMKFEATDKEVIVLINENYFLSDDKDLSSDEEIALHILANKQFNTSSNQEKIDILRTIALAKGISDLSEYENLIELDKKEFNRFLSKKKVLKHIRNYHIRKNPYLNAAKIRFGYCITCHRSQGYKWPNVIVNCDNKSTKTNDNYFRWLYTALSRTSSKLFLVNPPVIKPTINLKLSDNLEIPINAAIDLKIIPENFIDIAMLSNQDRFPEDRPQLLGFYKIVLDRIEGSLYKIKNIKHNKFQECYHIEINNQVFRVRFSYDGKFQFKKPNTANPVEGKFIEHLYRANDIQFFPNNFLRDFYLLLKSKLLNQNVEIFSVEHGNSAETYTLVRGEEILISIIYYTAEQFFTSVIIQKTNSQNILDDFKAIIETKLL